MSRSKFPFQPSAFYLAVATAAFGCGGTGQDTGVSKNFQQTLQGVAVDGYLARATVYLDYDNNSTRDPWEPFAFTDDNGYYSFNPLTNTDYCAVDADAQSALYCLRNTRPVAESVLRVNGGYDVLTGEPFVGQLSRRIDLSDTERPVSAVVSPLTTLLTNVRTSEDREKLFSALGIDEADIDVDFMNIDGANTVDGTLLNVTLKLHKTVSVLANLLETRYSEIGSQAGAANDMSSSIYHHLASQMVSRELELDDVLSDTQAMSAVMQAAESDAHRIYDQWDMELPEGSQAQVFMDYGRALQHGTQLVQIINQVVAPTQHFTSEEEVRGSARLVESLTVKALNESSQGNTFTSAVTFLQNTSNGSLIQSLIENLGHPASDLNRLTQHNFSGSDFDSSEAIRDLVRLPENTQPFAQIAGKQLRVSDMDLGSAPNNLKDSEVELYFHDSGNDSRGTFDACVKYIKEAHSDGALGDANTRGELVSGYWSLLDADRNHGESYSLLLNIEFLGSTYQAILKPAGTVSLNNLTMQVIRFDHAGKLRAWHSAVGLQTISSLPNSDADCEQRLPSRVGL